MSPTPVKVLLLVEDNPGDARLLREMLREGSAGDTELTVVGSMAEAEAHLVSRPVDIILLDLGLPDAEGLDAIRRAHIAAPHIPLVVLTGRDDEALAGQALQDGAQDYLIKGQIEPRGLGRALRYAIERKAMEESLFAEKERAEVTLNSIGDAVICTDISGNITFLNLVAERMTGWLRQDAAGRPMADVLRILNAASRNMIADPMEKAVARDLTMHLPTNSILIRRDGFEIPIEDTVAPIHDRQGQITGAVIVFRDVSAVRTLALELAHSAHHDFLTGLPNRMLLNDRADQAIAAAPRHNNKVAVLFLDLDGFKHINDSLGHPMGDKLLQSIAKRLVACVRGADTVSRQGGDEFVILLSEVARAEDAAILARRILQMVADSHSVDEHQLHVTASIGVSVYPDDGLDAETLIKNADTAMYQAKDAGRQNYKFFKPSMNVRAVERQSVEEGLRRALARQEFVLHYQPKIDLKTGAVTGVEALVRWNHPERGLLLPLEFVPIAEDSGLIVPLGEWVINEACRQAVAWSEMGLEMGTVAVNVSAIEFRKARYLEGVETALADSGLDASRLELELTESVLLQDNEITGNLLKALKGLGVRLALDDFGTGFSSLSYLRRFPISTLKIDRFFIQELTNSSGDTSLVVAIIAMGKSLGQVLVAEGIETEDQLDLLRALGCDEGQGFYFSRPLPAEDLTIYLGAPRNGIEIASVAGRITRGGRRLLQKSGT